MEKTINTVSTRPIEELRAAKYDEMSTAEINKLRFEDPAAFTAVETAFNAQFAPAPPAEGEEPLPMSKARQIYRNGELVDVSTAVRYVNGIPQ